MFKYVPITAVNVIDYEEITDKLLSLHEFNYTFQDIISLLAYSLSNGIEHPQFPRAIGSDRVKLKQVYNTLKRYVLMGLTKCGIERLPYPIRIEFNHQTHCLIILMRLPYQEALCAPQ